TAHGAGKLFRTRRANGAPHPGPRPPHFARRVDAPRGAGHARAGSRPGPHALGAASDPGASGLGPQSQRASGKRRRRDRQNHNAGLRAQGMAFLRSPLPEDYLEPICGPKVTLRPPGLSDYSAWAEIRALSRAHLSPWEPTWTRDELTRLAYRRR